MCLELKPGESHQPRGKERSGNDAEIKSTQEIGQSHRHTHDSTDRSHVAGDFPEKIDTQYDNIQESGANHEVGQNGGYLQPFQQVIGKIEEYNAFGQKGSRYRVDFEGVTVKSMIDNFQTAKSIAIRQVKS